MPLQSSSPPAASARKVSRWCWEDRVEGRGSGVAAGVDGGKAVGPRWCLRLREGAAGRGPAGAGRRGVDMRRACSGGRGGGMARWVNPARGPVPPGLRQDPQHGTRRRSDRSDGRPGAGASGHAQSEALPDAVRCSRPVFQVAAASRHHPPSRTRGTLSSSARRARPPALPRRQRGAAQGADPVQEMGVRPPPLGLSRGDGLLTDASSASQAWSRSGRAARA
jgi:hypothetical protein